MVKTSVCKLCGAEILTNRQGRGRKKFWCDECRPKYRREYMRAAKQRERQRAGDREE